ncbi:hypothetical protein [Noviherbaspirillum saxi]|uniref:Uncharacterized protein n=1 Tax=Noviherbaspirillum saxi TaxID=2320863 RepID=A0A3A3FSH8_9BURK|nr:hypothetical protein [Noviherbaspirillum saxi]RJF99006.1 hypothetical protein D3871_11175 [Noviherbaspirillum saxi]
MNGPGEAAGLAFFKLYGLKAGLGMIGAALLYFVLPPVKPDGTFDQREFVVRLACAGIASMVFGDLAVDVLVSYLPSVPLAENRSAVYLLVGAPAWWVTRAAALWLHKRNGKDIAEAAEEVRKTV